mmetsp:Transcript_21489/g.44658  ORF Transcript_21489/g.44658 Transcript_21489/m.44658 type:complete len:215 (+) Transcript_21489:391-1035(+)
MWAPAAYQIRRASSEHSAMVRLSSAWRTRPGAEGLRGTRCRACPAPSTWMAHASGMQRWPCRSRWQSSAPAPPRSRSASPRASAAPAEPPSAPAARRWRRRSSGAELWAAPCAARPARWRRRPPRPSPAEGSGCWRTTGELCNSEMGLQNWEAASQTTMPSPPAARRTSSCGGLRATAGKSPTASLRWASRCVRTLPRCGSCCMGWSRTRTCHA